MSDKPRRYISLKKSDKKTFVPRGGDRSRVITPTGTAAEVGRELRNFIRVVDVYIIGGTKNWDNLLKKKFVLARHTVGKSPREEAEALNSLIDVVSFHMINPSRWKHKAWHPEIIPAMQIAREILGLKEDSRFEEGEGILRWRT